MSLIWRIGKSSSIYTATAFLQKGISFLLLPLYTRYLTPNDYGILAVVTSVNSFFLILFMLSLPAAMTRFYFDHQDNPDILKKIWGSILTFILMLSLVFGSILIGVGAYLLKPVIGEIPFRPFVALGIGAVVFQPFFSIYLSILQTTEQSLRYGVYSLAQFLISVFLVIALVVFAGWGAEGPLTAVFVTAIAFFLLSLWEMRKYIQFGINWRLLKEALKYSLPLIPHELSSQVSNVVGRLYLNTLISTASAGIYNIGFLFGSVVSFFTGSVNRAYVPVSMGVRSKNDQIELDNLKDICLLIIVLYCLIGTAISLFSKEIIMLFTTKAFYESYSIVPFVAFGFVLEGIYYILVNILFFVKHATKFVAIGTFLGALTNILIGWWLIPHLGIMGAALAALSAQGAIVLLTGIIGYSYDEIRWNYGKIIALVLLSFLCSIVFIVFDDLNFWTAIGLKMLVLFLVFMSVNYVAWGNGFYLLEQGYHLIRKIRYP
jgi:O-antigen/teichoic acid export membrane protein